jgi:hypothetical protein
MSEKTFYVYTLACPDGRVFYVGKGSGNRKDMHIRQARNGGRERRHQVIREIEAAGEQVVVQVRESGLSESSAFLLERTYLEIFESDFLTNVNNRISRAAPPADVPVGPPVLAPSPAPVTLSSMSIGEAMRSVSARLSPVLERVRARLAASPDPADREMLARVFGDTTHPHCTPVPIPDYITQQSS